MPYKPKYRLGEMVKVQLKNGCYTGRISILEAAKVFRNSVEPSYDVFVENDPEYPEGVIYKHIRESQIHQF